MPQMYTLNSFIMNQSIILALSDRIKWRRLKNSTSQIAGCHHRKSHTFTSYHQKCMITVVPCIFMWYRFDSQDVINKHLHFWWCCCCVHVWTCFLSLSLSVSTPHKFCFVRHATNICRCTLLHYIFISNVVVIICCDFHLLIV